MATRKTRSARKTSTTRKTAAASKSTATPTTPAAEPTTVEMTEASEKLNALLNTEEQENSKEESTPTSDADKQDEAAPAADAATPAAAPAAAPAAPAVKKVKLLPGQIDPTTAPPLGADEFDIEVPAPGSTEKIVKRFRKPKDGRWVVSASARSAAMWHVVDLDADDPTRVLCTLVHTKWVGGRDDRDPQTKRITCEWCLIRALASGMTTEQEQAEIAKKEIEAKKEAQRAARKAKADAAAAAKLAANTAATAAASTAAAAAASADKDEADSAQAAGDEATTEAA